jgi:hypothetical protein
MTFLQLQTMVIESLHFALKAQSEYSLDRVKHYLNRGYYDFVKLTKCMEDIIDVTTVADQEYYTKADKADIEFIYHPYEVRYIEKGSTDIGYKLRPYRGGHSALPRVKSYARPDYYWTQKVNSKDGFIIGTWTIASSAGDTLRIYTYMFPSTDMNVDGDIPEIKEAYQDALVDYAISKIYKIFSKINKEWTSLSKEHWAYYQDAVNKYNYEMALDSEDEVPTLFYEE